MKISFVIPNYKQTMLLHQCLQRLRKFHPENEVIVVDDGSTKDTQDFCADICKKFNAKFLTSHWNNGFSHSANRGIESSKSDIVVLTNNDIVFTRNVESEIIKIFESDEKIGIIGFLLYYPDGAIQHGGHKRLDNFYSMGHEDHGLTQDKAKLAFKSRYAIGVTGALMAIRKSMCDEIGVFKTVYKLAFEDVELCLRAWHTDWRVYYTADVSAIHIEGATRGNCQEHKEKLGTWKQETESQTQYIQDSEHFYMNGIEKKVKELNTINNSVCFVRSGALGDCIMLTGIINEYKRRNPDSKIYVKTRESYPFIGNPNIDKVYAIDKEVLFNIMFNMDLCYEKRPAIPRLRAYADYVFGENNYNNKDIIPELYFENDREFNEKFKYLLCKPFIIVHPAKTWESRTVDKDVWNQVYAKIIANKTVVIVGKESDTEPFVLNQNGNAVIDLRGKLKLNQIHLLINLSEVFIGADSGLIHIAQTTKRPIVGIFSCVSPSVTVWRPEKFKTIIPQSECKYCLTYKVKPPVTILECELKTNECIKSITAEDILKGLDEVLK